MATADDVYADPSALLKLYLHEPQSRAMTAWRSKVTSPLVVTLHGQVEMYNAIGLARHRDLITTRAYEAAIGAIDDDFAHGRYRIADLLWRATLKRAGELSREYTKQFGTRSLDVLHVASALEMGLRRFLTFDERQQALARATGLRLIAPAR